MTPMARRSRLVRPTIQGLAFLLLALGSGCGDPMISPMEDAGPTRCEEGYVAEGERCVDVDECALGVHDCAGALTCMNERLHVADRHDGVDAGGLVARRDRQRGRAADVDGERPLTAPCAHGDDPIHSSNSRSRV